MFPSLFAQQLIQQPWRGGEGVLIMHRRVPDGQPDVHPILNQN